jgi:hypothetical protein
VTPHPTGLRPATFSRKGRRKTELSVSLNIHKLRTQLGLIAEKFTQIFNEIRNPEQVGVLPFDIFRSVVTRSFKLVDHNGFCREEVTTPLPEILQIGVNAWAK